MEHKHNGSELDALIRASVHIAEEPSLALNNSLKGDLYRREAVLRRQAQTRAISLWYLPMLLNLVTFGLLAAMAPMAIANPYVSKLVVGICCYLGFAGIILTVLGVKRTKMKEEITVHIRKRGVIA